MAELWSIIERKSAIAVWGRVGDGLGGRVLGDGLGTGGGGPGQPPAIAGRITTVSDSDTEVSSPSSTRTSSSLR
jgi:hypothetical protein